MKSIHLSVLCQLSAAAAPGCFAQETPPAGTPTPFTLPGTVTTPSVSGTEGEWSTNDPMLLEEVAAQKPHHDDLLECDLSLDYRRPANGGYNSLTSVTLSLTGMINEHDSVGLLINGGAFQLKRGSLADRVAYAPYFGEIGLLGKHYLTRPKNFLRPYITGSCSLMWMVWEYRAGTVPPDTDTGGYYLKGIDAYVGCGLAVRLHKRLSVFGEVGGGGVALYDDTTDDYVNRTVFDSFGYVSVKGGLRFAF